MRSQSTDPLSDYSAASLQPDELFVPNAWREPLQGVLSALAERRPLTLLVAADGRGKSTFLKCLGPAASVMATPTEVFVVAGAPPADWLEGAAAAFDLAGVGDGRDDWMAALSRGLARYVDRGNHAVIAVDDAHLLSRSSMAELLTLANDWPSGGAPPSFLLAGTSDLAERIAAAAPRGEVRSLPRFSLAPWGSEDLGAFIRHRVARQSGNHERFSPEAIARVHELSAGEPATVSRMVARALQLAQRSGDASVVMRITIDYAATSLAGDLVDADDPADHRMSQFSFAGRSSTTTVSELAEGVGPQRLAGCPPLHTPGHGDDAEPADPASARSSADAPSSNRRLTKFGVAAAALAIVGVALWSQSRGPDGASDRTVLPAPTVSNQEASKDNGSVEAAGQASSTSSDPPGASVPLPAEEEPLAAPVAPSPPTPVATDDTPRPAQNVVSEETAALTERGDALMRLSDVSSARQFYLLAARRGDPVAYTAVASTYDPVFLQTSGVRGARGDATQAIDWYRQAMRRGDPLARSRLASLLTHLRASGEIDENEAQRLLDSPS